MPLSQVLAGLPAFLLCFALGMVLLAVFLVVYLAVTPYNEIALIRDGNVAAAISLGGAIIGFVLPLASAIAHSVGLIDMLVWASIALVAQVAAYFLISRLVPHFPEAVKAGRVAGAALLAAVAVAVGLINAACLTY